MFKEKLKRYIQIQGISQAELADIVGDTQQAISDFLKKEGNPQRKTRDKYLIKLEGFQEYLLSTSKKQETKEETVIKESVLDNVIKVPLDDTLFDDPLSLLAYYRFLSRNHERFKEDEIYQLFLERVKRESSNDVFMEEIKKIYEILSNLNNT